MKKIALLLLSFILFVTTSYGDDGNRVCKNIYSEVGGVKYFSSIHCTEDIKLTGVVPDDAPLKEMSARVMNDFIIANNNKIVEHLEGSGSCDELNKISEIKSFEDKIYGTNDISYSNATSKIEDITEDIEDMMDEYNSEDLYSKIFNETQSKYPLSSVNYLRIAAAQAYYDKQVEIKEDILEKEKEKVTLLHKLTESQKFVENFYVKVEKICHDYVNSGSIKLDDDKDEEKDSRDDLIKKYKADFNEKLGKKLDSLSNSTLKQLSVKLIGYPYTSPIFKRFTPEQKEIVKLKIEGLREAINDRID